MKTLFFSFFILSGCCAYAQEMTIKPVNRDSIKLAIEDSSKSTYYPKLLQRYNQFDTTLTLDEYRHIYYGFVFQDIYSPYANDKVSEMGQLVKKKKYNKALKISDEVLSTMPVALKANFLKGMMLHYMKQTDSVMIYAFRYRMLRDAIFSTGDGIACETAFKTIFVSDEYEVLKSLELTSMGQSLQHPCDKLIVTPSKHFDKAAIYFDTSETFRAMNKMFRGIK